MAEGWTPRVAPPGSAEESWPVWVTGLRAALMVMIFIGVALDASIPNRGVAIALTAAAVSPWLLEAVGVRLSGAVFAAVALAPVAVMNLGAGYLDLRDEHDSVQFTLLIAVFLVGEAVSLYSPRLATAVVMAVLAVSLLSRGQGAIWALAVGVAATCGLLLRALTQAMVELGAAQATLAAEAAQEERRRIAREVHDVIAHSLTVAMLHITAARLAVARGDDSAASEALEEAERASRESLAEVRRTVGLLRRDSALEAPAPLASDIHDLVSGWQAAGMQATLEVDGDLTTVPAQVGLALYRIVQESLANSARHSPTAAVSVVVWAHDPARVSVSTHGASSAPSAVAGSGLIGMRERAEALGGSCQAGLGDDGWVVEAVLPSPQAELSS